MRQRVEDRMRDSQAIVERLTARLFDQALASRTPSRPAADPAAPKAGHMTATVPSRSKRQKNLDPRGPSTHDILIEAAGERVFPVPLEVSQHEISKASVDPDQ